MSNIKKGQVWTEINTGKDYIIEELLCKDFILISYINDKKDAKIISSQYTLQNKYILKSEHYVYNNQQDIDITTTSLPLGYSFVTGAQEKKMTREETWADLFYPKINLCPSDEELAKYKKSKNKIECQHIWQNYIGFNRSYLFCTICDLKKEHE